MEVTKLKLHTASRYLFAGTYGRGVYAIPAASPTVAAGGIVNAANYQGTGIAPGEIVTIFGTALGPPTPAALTIGSDGKVSNNAGAVRVLFDGVAAPVVNALATQVSVVVPYEVAGKSTTGVQVEFEGIQSAPISTAVTDAAPGIFTANASGTGQAAAVNQDGSLNNAGTPAAAGSAIAFYLTGAGQINPGGTDGEITGANPGLTVLPVTAEVGGLKADVLYAGAAPGLVSGVVQVNVRPESQLR
jgi:uncharacterized protein (TIGR03437 family)